MLNSEKPVKIIFLLIFGFFSILLFANASDIDSVGPLFIFPFFFIITALGIFQRVFIISLFMMVPYMIFLGPSAFDDDFPLGIALSTIITFSVMGLPLFFQKLNVTVIEFMGLGIMGLSLSINAVLTGVIPTINLSGYRHYHHDFRMVSIDTEPVLFYISFFGYLIFGILFAYDTYKNFKNKKFFNPEKSLEN